MALFGLPIGSDLEAERGWDATKALQKAIDELLLQNSSLISGEIIDYSFQSVIPLSFTLL